MAGDGRRGFHTNFFFRTRPPKRGVTGRDGTVQLQKKYITGRLLGSSAKRKNAQVSMNILFLDDTADGFVSPIKASLR